MKPFEREQILKLLNAESTTLSPAEKLSQTMWLYEIGLLSEPNVEEYEQDGNGD